MGGGENARTKDAALLHQPPETFVSMLVLDGVLERHPELKGRRLSSEQVGFQS